MEQASPLLNDYMIVYCMILYDCMAPKPDQVRHNNCRGPDGMYHIPVQCSAVWMGVLKLV